MPIYVNKCECACVCAFWSCKHLWNLYTLSVLSSSKFALDYLLVVDTIIFILCKDIGRTPSLKIKNTIFYQLSHVSTTCGRILVGSFKYHPSWIQKEIIDRSPGFIRQVIFCWYAATKSNKYLHWSVVYNQVRITCIDLLVMNSIDLLVKQKTILISGACSSNFSFDAIFHFDFCLR